MNYTIGAQVTSDNGDTWDLEEFRLLHATLTSPDSSTGLALVEWTHSQTGETTWQAHQITLTSLGSYASKAEALAAMGATSHDI